MRKSFTDIGEAFQHDSVTSPTMFRQVGEYLKMVRASAGPNGARLFFIGNGGSAAIASHMAADYMKNGGFPTFCFNDGALMSCIANDLSYDQVFSRPLRMHGRFGDVLFAVSSSGESHSILNAVKSAIERKMNVVTLSGFDPENHLRTMGGVNFYVPSNSYGTVEVVHLAILHSILDEVMENDRS